MTREELLDEGYEKALTFEGYAVMQKQSCFQYGYLASAEPREKRIEELEAQIEQLVYLHEEDVNTIKLLNKQIEKMRNFQNCDYQLHVTDCPIFKSGGHISCEKCPHWILQEVKENEYD